MRKSNKNNKLPDDNTLIELLKIHKSTKQVLKALGKTYKSSKRITELGRKYKLLEEKKYKVIQKQQIDEQLENNYKEIDNFKIGFEFKSEGHKWVIQAINNRQKEIISLY